MRDVERVLGALEEFKDTTKARLESIERKVESIQHLKWKIVGGTTVVSFLLSIVIDFMVRR